MMKHRILLNRILALFLTACIFSSVPIMAEEALKAGMVDPKTGKKIKYWVAPMDPTYIRNEPGQSPMGMDLVPVYEEEGMEKEPASTIRIDPATVQNMGVRLGQVKSQVLSKQIRTFGSITYNEKEVYTVNTKFDGWIEKLHVDFLGERVAKGQPLFEIYSPELFAAQQEYLLAFQQYQHRRIQSTRTLLEAARTRLSYWDLKEYQIRQIETSGEIRKTLTIYSPANGVVTKKNAFQGHFVKAGMHQYEIADLSTVWVDVDIYEYELPWVREGMRAEMELAYVPGRRLRGEVLFIYPYLDPKTRTAKLRLSFDNSDEALKPGMWANIYLESDLPGRQLVIPQEAVIDSGVRKVVFVSLGKGRFMPREVTLGVEGNDYLVQVLEGLEADEKIVLSGQFLLDSESRLQEAIQKMLSARQGDGVSETGAEEDLDMSDMTMDSESVETSDDLDMKGLTMESGDDLNMDDLTMEPATE